MATGAGLTGIELFPRFSDQEFARRYRAVRDAMDEEGLDAVLITGAQGATEISYLINYLPTTPSWLVFPREGEASCFLGLFNHGNCAQEQAIIDDVRWIGRAPMETVANNLLERGLGNGKIGLVSLSSISYNNFMDLQRRLPGVEFSEFGRQYSRIRWVKSEEEIPYIRRSGYLTDLICEALEQRLRPGMSEHDIKSIFYEAYVKHGGEPGTHFVATTNMMDPDRCNPWQRPTPRTITKGSVVITELTATYWGYNTQIHRAYAIGQEPTPLYREMFEVALECYESVRRICRPGISSEEIVEATSVIEDRGFTTYDSVFHGERATFPELGTRSAAHPIQPWILMENMVHVIQPNITTRDFKAGLQLGAAVLVRPDGGECLHNYPFKFPVCGA